jgi:hypothetical protein
MCSRLIISRGSWIRPARVQRRVLTRVQRGLAVLVGGHTPDGLAADPAVPDGDRPADLRGHGRLVGQQHLGSLASAAAMAARCCSPPDIRSGVRSAQYAMPRVSSRKPARRSRSRRASRVNRIGSTTFCRAVR